MLYYRPNETSTYISDQFSRTLYRMYLQLRVNTTFKAM